MPARIISSQSLVKKITCFLPHTLGKHVPLNIVIIEANPQESLRLNLAYRKNNKPANVLSFYYSADYGEIIVCPVLIRKEAKKEGCSCSFQMTRMIVHGILHLAGLHHEKSRYAEKKTDHLEHIILTKLRL